MGEKTVVQTDLAPRPVGPYSQAVKAHNMLFIAGQIALSPNGNKLVGADAGEQTRQALKNIDAILTFSGLTASHLVRCTVYVTDLKEIGDVNQAFQEYFLYEPPVRTTVQVAALPLGAKVEIEATAVIPTVTATPIGGARL